MDKNAAGAGQLLHAYWGCMQNTAEQLQFITRPCWKGMTAAALGGPPSLALLLVIGECSLAFLVFQQSAAGALPNAH